MARNSAAAKRLLTFPPEILTVISAKSQAPESLAMNTLAVITPHERRSVYEMKTTPKSRRQKPDEKSGVKSRTICFESQHLTSAGRPILHRPRQWHNGWL